MTTDQTDQITERKAYHQNLMDKLSLKAGDVETCRPEGDDDKERYAKKLEQRFSTVKSVMDDFSEIAKDREKEIRTEFEEKMDALRKRSEDVKSSLVQLRASGENAGTELGTGIESAIEEITDGIKSAASRLK